MYINCVAEMPFWDASDPANAICVYISIWQTFEGMTCLTIWDSLKT